MATHSRAPRRSTQGVSYSLPNPSLGEDSAGESDSNQGYDHFGNAAKRLCVTPLVKKRRVREVANEDESENETDDVLSPKAYLLSVPVVEPEDDVEYEVKRTDLTKILPVETLAQIFSHLHPATLYILANLSRALRAVLKSNSLAPVWRAAMRPKTLPWCVNVSASEYWAVPKLGGKDVDLYKLAAVMFAKECEHCGRRMVFSCDISLLVRLCNVCRVENFLTVTEAGKDKKHQNLHPATLQCVVSTAFSPIQCSPIDFALYRSPLLFTPQFAHPRHDPKWEPPHSYWVLQSDLWTISEKLEELQMVDDAKADGYVRDGVDMDIVQQTLRHAKRIKRRLGKENEERAKELGADLVKRYSPKVKEYVLERQELQKDRRKLAEWIWDVRRLYDDLEQEHADGHAYDKGLKISRLNNVEGRVAADNVFKLDSALANQLREHPLVDKAEPLTDESWDAIAPAIYRFIARHTARNILARCGKHDQCDSDDEGDLFKRPESVTVAGWKLIRPELAELAKRYKAAAKLYAKRQKELEATQGPRLKPAQLAAKDDFFRARWDKMVAIASEESGVSWAMPRYDEWRLLPTVAEMYADRSFGVGDSDEARQADIELWGKACLDAVRAEAAEFATDTRAAALRLILAATTEMGDELDSFDAVAALATDEYSDAFFCRAGSYVSCAFCPEEFGPLHEVLDHVNKVHVHAETLVPRSIREPKSTDDFLPQVELSLETACAWSAILELAGRDPHDIVGNSDLDKVFRRKNLVWENGLGMYKSPTLRWRRIIGRVTIRARAAHQEGTVLDVPIIALKGLTAYQRSHLS